MATINWYSKKKSFGQRGYRGYPNARVTLSNNKKNTQILITFREASYIHNNSAFCKVGIVDKRMYFMFTDKESMDGWKCQFTGKDRTSVVIKVVMHGNDDLRRFTKFVTSRLYKMEYDGDNELYYIAIEG